MGNLEEFPVLELTLAGFEPLADLFNLAPAFRRDQKKELNEKEMFFLKEGVIFLGHKG